MIYLDSAAVVKLVHAEPESAALRGWLNEIESFRTLARYAPQATSRLPAVLDQIDLIDLDQRIRMLAGRSPRQRCAAWMPSTSARPCAPAHH
jgi:uncharacterized protein